MIVKVGMTELRSLDMSDSDIMSCIAEEGTRSILIPEGETEGKGRRKRREKVRGGGARVTFFQYESIPPLVFKTKTVNLDFSFAKQTNTMLSWKILGPCFDIIILKCCVLLLFLPPELSTYKLSHVRACVRASVRHVYVCVCVCARVVTDCVAV